MAPVRSQEVGKVSQVIVQEAVLGGCLFTLAGGGDGFDTLLLPDPYTLAVEARNNIN